VTGPVASLDEMMCGGAGLKGGDWCHC
jgi:hypothetical protein